MLGNRLKRSFHQEFFLWSKPRQPQLTPSNLLCFRGGFLLSNSLDGQAEKEKGSWAVQEFCIANREDGSFLQLQVEKVVFFSNMVQHATCEWFKQFLFLQAEKLPLFFLQKDWHTGGSSLQARDRGTISVIITSEVLQKTGIKMLQIWRQTNPGDGVFFYKKKGTSFW